MVTRLVDAHVHHWQPSANGPWYPMLADPANAAMAHDYLRADYLDDSAAYEVAAIVHVSATSEPRAYLEEARWLDAMASRDGWPAATVGAVDPASPWEVVAADLEEQARSPLFRGVRVLFGLDPSAPLTDRLLRQLQDDQRVFDLVTHPDDMAAHVAMLDRVPDLTVVVEHAGWPLGTDAGQVQSWRAGMKALAERPNTYCKISGLAMTLHTLALDAQRPWVEGCLEAFGAHRCMVGSNFPVDRLFGSYDDLFATYRTVADELTAEDQHRLFEGTAREVYRL